MRPEKVAFIGRGLDVASTRYRIVIPAMELQKLGVEISKDASIIVYNKGSIDQKVLDLYQKKVYDICDDNIDCQERGAEYRKHLAIADAVTCNSDAMRFIVHQKVGRIATVIADPYEHDEWPPSWGDGLLWFGHWTNLKTLDRTGLEGVTVLTNMDGVPPHYPAAQIAARTPYIQWSPEAMDDAFKAHAIVIIPTGRGIAKSANRLIESVRAGKFVVAEPLPAYEEFGRWMWIGDLKKGIEWAKSNRQECMRRVRECQSYIRSRYSPETIGQKWLEVLSSI
jgi:glycosyltransferase involved in cell wall biosynthesis